MYCTGSGYFRVTNNGAYSIRFIVQYLLINECYCIPSCDFLVGETREICVPNGAYNIKLTVQYCNGTDYITLLQRMYTVPTQQCFVTSGLIFAPSISLVDSSCNYNYTNCCCPCYNCNSGCNGNCSRCSNYLC